MEKSPPPHNRFGRLVIDLMARMGMQNKKLAFKLHVSNASVSAWRAGTSFPNQKNLSKLVKELNWPAEEFVRA